MWPQMTTFNLPNVLTQYLSESPSHPVSSQFILLSADMHAKQHFFSCCGWPPFQMLSHLNFMI